MIKYFFTLSERKGIVKTLGEASATRFLSMGVGDEEKEKLVMCVYASVSLTSVSLRIVDIVNGLPANLEGSGT